MMLRHIDSRTRIDETGIKRRDEYEIGSYNVMKFTHYESNGAIYKTFTIHADANAEYMPDIYYCDFPWNDEKPTFEIQTTAYGSKSPAEIDKIIKGYQEASEVTKKLINVFCR